LREARQRTRCNNLSSEYLESRQWAQSTWQQLRERTPVVAKTLSEARESGEGTDLANMKFTIPSPDPRPPIPTNPVACSSSRAWGRARRSRWPGARAGVLLLSCRPICAELVFPGGRSRTRQGRRQHPCCSWGTRPLREHRQGQLSDCEVVGSRPWGARTNRKNTHTHTHTHTCVLCSSGF